MKTRVFPVATFLLIGIASWSCTPREFTLEDPSPNVIAKLAGIIAQDPAGRLYLQSVGDPLSVGAPIICFLPETQPIFAFEYMPGAHAADVDYIAGLEETFRSSLLDVESVRAASNASAAYSEILQAKDCPRDAGVFRLWLSVSPIVVNPAATRANAAGLFATVEVESDQGLIVERLVYWAEVEDDPTLGRYSVTRTVRIARGLDKILLEDTQIFPHL